MLGSALWGWGTTDEEAFELLDAYVESGGSWIDTAVNYPINKQPEDFGRANKILREWIKSNPGADIKVFCKVGSVNNSGGPETALSASDIQVSTELVVGQFGPALQGIGIHWDNRDGEADIADTLSGIQAIENEGFKIGFSGIKHPEIYASLAPHLADKWHIQVKENAATHAARSHYQPHFPNAKYYAYGINMGGVKTSAPSANSSVSLRGVTEPEIAERLRRLIANWDSALITPETLNHLALISTYGNEAISGLILGPRNLDQLSDSLGFIKKIEATGNAVELARFISERLEESA